MGTQKHIQHKNLMSNESQKSDLHRIKRRKICIILVWVLAFLVALTILFTILALTLFKPKKPETTINTVSLQDFDAKFDITKFRFLINLTLFIDLSIKNPNRVGFKYEPSVAFLKYKDGEVGEAPIEAGEIGKQETKPMNLTMTLMADKLLFDSGVYSKGGSLPLSTSVELTGKVQLLFKIKVKTYSTCDFNIDVVTQALSNMSCHYTTKL